MTENDLFTYSALNKWVNSISYLLGSGEFEKIQKSTLRNNITDKQLAFGQLYIYPCQYKGKKKFIPPHSHIQIIAEDD